MRVEGNSMNNQKMKKTWNEEFLWNAVTRKAVDEVWVDEELGRVWSKFCRDTDVPGNRKINQYGEPNFETLVK